MNSSTTLPDRFSTRPRGRRDTGPVLPAFFGRYLLLERLGSGGMGTVYRASTLRGPDVALKVLVAQHEFPDSRTRFAREIAAMAAVEHPGVVRVLDWGEVDGQPYYAMELARGVNLRELVEQRGALSWPRAVAIVRRLAEAIACTHAAGLIHRDVKPGNVMLDPDADVDAPKLLDFGLVLEPDREGERITLDGCLLGTPGYLAPEGMLSARALSASSDLYGLALIAAHLLHGRPVFRPSELTSEEAHAAARDRAIDGLDHVPRRIRELLRRALAYDPRRRPGLDTFRAALDAVLEPFE